MAILFALVVYFMERTGGLGFGGEFTLFRFLSEKKRLGVLMWVEVNSILDEKSTGRL